MQIRQKLAVKDSLRAMPEVKKPKGKGIYKRIPTQKKELMVIKYLEGRYGHSESIKSISEALGGGHAMWAYGAVKNLLKRGRIVREQFKDGWGYRVEGAVTIQHREPAPTKNQPVFAEVIPQKAQEYIWDNDLTLEEINGIKKFVKGLE